MTLYRFVYFSYPAFQATGQVPARDQGGQEGQEGEAEAEGCCQGRGQGEIFILAIFS
jgi:hypothetical protein